MTAFKKIASDLDTAGSEALETYKQRKAEWLARMRNERLGARKVRADLVYLSRMTDSTLRALWKAADFGAEFALLAVGGYGRGELFSYSDVDVLVLLPDSAQPIDDEALRQRIERFVSSCWDSGLEIGASVRTVDDCLALAQSDVTVQTALLESRWIIGQRALFRRFKMAFDQALDPLAFFIAKQLEMRQRHAKYEDTPYALEPNCKESPGGLRDLQIISWTARAAGIGGGWVHLARAGLATPHEVRQLKHNEALLSRIRARLHLIAGRREDRLVFDLQTAVAESFGHGTQLGPDGRLAVRASEALMRDYYWAAKAVTQLNQILLQGIEAHLRAARGEPAAELRPLNPRFFERAGLIEVADDGLYRREPHAILETFLLYTQTPGAKGLSVRTLRALYNARSLMDHAFRTDPVNRRTFLAILQQPQGITHALRLMNQTSVLGRYLWVFRRIVGQMQHDLFHVYTVDQHILMVVRNVRRFFLAEHAHEYPFCSALAGGWDKPWVLYVAALFHDIAKGRNGDHSTLGAVEVRRFCRDHGIAQEDTRLIEFLVREHLLMSQIAQKSDLSDPDVIQAFAQRVGHERDLTALYLLTVADIRGTSPKVWNAWKGKLLEDLYRLTVRALGGRAPDAGALIEARKRDALGRLRDDPASPVAPPALWSTLDVSYFMRHDAADIAWHARELAMHVPPPSIPRRRETDAPQATSSPQGAIVRARPSPVADGLQVLVYTPDQPDLFARICGYFDRAGFSILDAKIHTTQNGYALDTFQVVSDLLPEDQHALPQQIEAELSRRIDSQSPLPAPRMGRVSRRVKSFPVTPRVDLRPDEKAQRWLLTVSASDRVGLLYGIARVLGAHGINLELAKITTLGERVEDTFLIQGDQLQHSKTQLDIEQELLDVLTSG